MLFIHLRNQKSIFEPFHRQEEIVQSGRHQCQEVGQKFRLRMILFIVLRHNVLWFGNDDMPVVMF